jgi:hypothetical protein
MTHADLAAGAARFFSGLEQLEMALRYHPPWPACPLASLWRYMLQHSSRDYPQFFLGYCSGTFPRIKLIMLLTLWVIYVTTFYVGHVNCSLTH